MTKPRTRRLKELAELLDEETCARIDAELAAEGADPTFVPPQVEWLPDPDPFGLNWEWAKAGPHEERTDPVAPARDPSSAPRRRVLRLAGYTVAAGVAAALLVALGAILGNLGTKEPGPLIAHVEVRGSAPRGPGSIPDLVVENRSDRKAFVTVVGLSPNRRPAVLYRETQRFVDVPPHGSRVIQNLPESFDGSTLLLVVLTGSPAGEAVRDSLPDRSQGEAIEGVRDALVRALEALGYRGTAIESVRPSAGP